MMTKLAVVQDLVHFSEIMDGGTPDVDLRPMHSPSQLASLVVHVFQVILEQG